MATVSTVFAEETASWAWWAAGRVDEFPRLPGRLSVCRCGWASAGPDRGWDEWHEHVIPAGTAELERRGLLALTGHTFAGPHWAVGLSWGLGGIVGWYVGAAIKPLLRRQALRRLLGLRTAAPAAAHAVTP